jgi:DNA-3-methyladenine glycosylase I
MGRMTLVTGDDGVTRCWWCGADPLYVHYHDTEWGRPVYDDGRPDDHRLFEKLCLEGFQSGLAWITILRKRENFRAAFDRFDPVAISNYGLDDVERLVANAGIVRHRGKIESTINNARRMLELELPLRELVERYRPDEPHRVRSIDDVAALTPESTALSKELKRRGWSFVGPTTVYAFMQAMGLVNDHLVGCSAFDACER